MLELWNNEYPEKLNYNNLFQFEEYLAELTGITHFLLIENKDSIMGWAYSFIRNDEKWFAIILSEKQQGKGHGSELLAHLKQSDNQLNGWVIDHNNDLIKNGKVYKSPLVFYLKNGFEIIENERLELDKISAVKIQWINKKL